MSDNERDLGRVEGQLTLILEGQKRMEEKLDNHLLKVHPKIDKDITKIKTYFVVVSGGVALGFEVFKSWLGFK